MSRPGSRKKISVTEGKARFLELVREVERGRVIEITKHGKTIACLAPADEAKAEPPLFGFGKVRILGDIVSPLGDADWTFDELNIKPRLLKASEPKE